MKSEDHSIAYTFRLEKSIAVQLDAAAERLNKENPGLGIIRADVVRMALHEWLATHGKKTK